MESTNRPYLSQVDEIRALAALLVFFFHIHLLGYYAAGLTGWPRAHNPLSSIIVEGHTGVSLFIVLSGFILSYGTTGKQIEYRKFITNRVLRIFPLMTVLVFSAIYSNKNNTVSEIFAPLLLLQNSAPLSIHDASNLTGMLWTVSVEFQFYLIAPFLIHFVAREGVMSFAIPFAVFMICIKIIALYSVRDDVEALWSYPYVSIVGRINQFLLGIVIGVNWNNIRQFRGRCARSIGAGLLIAGFMSISLLTYVMNKEGGGEHVWFRWRTVQLEAEAVSWGAFISGYILVDPLASVRVVRGILRRVGIISFSMYLLHWAILTMVFSLARAAAEPGTIGLRGFTIMGFLIILPITLIVSGLSYWCIERPFLNLRSHYMANDRRGAASNSSTRTLP